MTWLISDGSSSTINIGPHVGGDEVMFAWKELLKQAGWTVKSSGDATSYNASADIITTSASGAGGLGNSNAWFRIQDPGVLREYVVQRGASNLSWKIIYSASDKFTGGTPNATTIPTATDQQGIARNATSFQSMFIAANTHHTHIAAQDTPHNGVYCWWLTSYHSEITSNRERTTIFCDAMDASFSSGDNDPCVHYGSDDKPVGSTTGSTGATSTDHVKGWMQYNTASEEWQGLSTIYYTALSFPYAPYYVGANPHNGKYPILPIHYFRHSSTGSSTGIKGMGKFIKWKPNANHNYPMVLDDGSDNYLVWGDLALPGFPSGITPR